MRITRLHIQNFRCIKDLAIDLGETTVFIGQNNAGKTAIIDSVRIVLTRRWGQRGTGFTENDVHRPDPDGDPRALPPVTITLIMEEGEPGEWDPDMVAALNDIRRELGSGKGRGPHWLIFNDEAHHAYRRGDAEADDQSLDEDKDLAKKNEREATIWIEGLDRINKLAGGSRRRGINLCIDLSATPFYIQGSGNEVGKPFPWVVSDFGLLDAIESGLVKIPQLPARDVTGAEEAAYFNIWRWVQAKAKEEGYGTNLTPEIVMNYASAPINLLAAEWHQRFVEWEQFSKQQHKHPVPPVFIVVCRDTAVAKEVHAWLANGNDGYGVSPPWFRNTPGQEVTVRIDSKVIEGSSYRLRQHADLMPEHVRSKATITPPTPAPLRRPRGRPPKNDHITATT